MRISQLLRFPWRRPRKPPSADFTDAAPSLILGTSKQDYTGGLSIGRAQDDPASQPSHPSVILEHSNLSPAADPRGSISQTPASASPPTSIDPSEHHTPLVAPQKLPSPTTTSHESPPLTPTLRRRSLQPQDTSPGIHYGTQNHYESRNVSVTGDTNTVMEELLKKTILGAKFDSSARYPPPRSYPGTRLAILGRCLYFIINRNNKKKMRWVVGTDGVGKSAIMRSVAESDLPPIIWRASIFFFVNGHNDGTKAIVTLAYQLAVKYEPYRQFIEREITCDPFLLHSSMSVQFNKFIVEPFTHHPQLNSTGRVLIILDGLDECRSPDTQWNLLQLISEFCLTYPSSPVVWMIASRPEPQIATFFAQASVKAVYEKEEVLVDFDKDHDDWPDERTFWKLANASGSRFAYASTVIRYLSNRAVAGPTEQLHDVLLVIDTHPLSPEGHPTARLDVLYSHILSKAPGRVRENMRKLLLSLVADWKHLAQEGSFIVLCNWLGMTSNEAYAALRHLSSVLKIPERGEAYKEDLQVFHESFVDYLSDYARSGFSSDMKHEAYQLRVLCTFRILEQAPDAIDYGNLDCIVRASRFPIGNLARGPGTGGNILLTWPVNEECDWDDNRTRLNMYKMAIATIMDGITRGHQALCTVFCIHLLTTRFQSFFGHGMPYLHKVVFHTSRHQEFTECGMLRRVPVKMLDFPRIKWAAWLQFRRPTPPATYVSDLWNLSCEHKRNGEWGEGKDQAWSTTFGLRHGFLTQCKFCSRRLQLQLKRWKTKFPDYPVSVLFTSAGIACVEFQFVDPEDGKSEWKYWLWHEFSEEERKKLGSTV